MPMKKNNRLITILCILYLIAAAYVSSLVYAEQLAYTPPQVCFKDISALQARTDAVFTSAECSEITCQTGLGRAAIEDIGNMRELEKYHKNYFTKPDYRRIFHTPFFCEEYVEKPTVTLAPLEDGDVLVTSSPHIFTWRSGHAAIVTDASSSTTLEATVIGQPSGFCGAEKWRHYPNFKILRLKGVPLETRRLAAQNAKAFFNDIPYNLLAGIYPMKYSEPDKLKSTQCAHLVWLAYASVGYDIDSDGGLIVTPENIANSDLFEIVQTYG